MQNAVKPNQLFLLTQQSHRSDPSIGCALTLDDINVTLLHPSLRLLKVNFDGCIKDTVTDVGIDIRDYLGPLLYDAG